jgi:hypothetical protein
MLIWPSSAYGVGLHTRSISLTLSSSFHVKGLTRRCYVKNNNKDYKLALALLPSLGTPSTDTAVRVDAAASGTGLHTRRALLTLLSSLRVKMLTWRCYVWNDKDYKLVLTLLIF